MPRLPALALLAALGVLLALGGGYMWLRDSSLVSVRRVSITGATGPDTGSIERALRRAARNMTTLHVRDDQLKNAVAPFPVVKDLRVDTAFPHGLRIRVIEQLPVAQITGAGRPLAVAGDGTLLHDVPAAALPAISVQVPPGGRRLADPGAMSRVLLLAAAPPAMLPRIVQVTLDPDHGLLAQLRNGPALRFGDGSTLRVKWQAAMAVLGDPGSAGADYIDVSDPRRPAAGSSSAATGTASSGSGTGSTASGSGTGSAASNAGAGSTTAGASGPGSGTGSAATSGTSSGAGAGGTGQ